MQTPTSSNIDHDCGKFITLPQEEILIAKREYWLLMLFPIAFSLLFSLVLLAVGTIIFLLGLHSFPLFLASILVILNATIGIVGRIFIHWYFHIYIVTTRKLLEVTYSPLDTLMENEVLLDQVRCTEVDMKRGGIFHELFNFGTIRITFDRPTHQQEFVLSNIHKHRQVGILLSRILVGFEAVGFTNPIQYYAANQLSRRMGAT